MYEASRDAAADPFAARLKRIRVATKRDETAAVRDRLASERDIEAAERDRRAERAERRMTSKPTTPAMAMEHADDVRWHAADDRRRAAEDRDQAARDRRAASVDRLGVAVVLDRAYLDHLTDVYRTEPGMAALRREFDRARRGDGRLVLAYVDVDGLDRVNRKEGRAAGDVVLHLLAMALRSRLRSFDPVVRMDGDEFAFSIPGATTDLVSSRLEEVRRVMSGYAAHAEFRVGLAELRDGDVLDDLVDRARAATMREQAAGR
jgi:diguanylate cyclase (GGDEF)-like protein